LEARLHELVRGLIDGFSGFRHPFAMKSNANEQVHFALQEVVSTTLKCWLDENKPELLHVFREVIGQNAIFKKPADKPASKSEVQFLDTAEIATRWRLNPETVRRMVRDGRLPRTPMSGRRILVPISAIVSYEGGHA
jgi:Helix-turn-helix domain